MALTRETGPAAEHRHALGPAGQLDESARRLSHEELAVARLLVGEGHHVRSQATADRPTADLSVCGRETEIKTLNPGATSRTVANALRRAAGQGRDVIVDARQSGLLRLAADHGVAAFAARSDRSGIERVRVLGNGFDRSYHGHDLDRMARHQGGRGLEPGVA
jgi:hypothetical protein